jgi:hypothetical protein
VGGVALQVAENDADEAVNILQDNPGLIGRRSSEDEGDSSDAVCLSCGKPMDETIDRCPQCGWTPF